MNVALFLLAFGWTTAIASTRLGTLSARHGGGSAAGPGGWRGILAVALFAAEAAMAVWAILALPLLVAVGILAAGLGIGWVAVTKATPAAIRYLKPALDAVALLVAVFLWGTLNPLT